MAKVVMPARLKIYIRENSKWFTSKPGKVFFNPHNTPANLKNIPEQYGTTNQKVIIELFRINGGKNGYYLADLKYKKYYYCGKEQENISKKLKEIGIGREDPRSN